MFVFYVVVVAVKMLLVAGGSLMPHMMRLGQTGCNQFILFWYTHIVCRENAKVTLLAYSSGWQYDDDDHHQVACSLSKYSSV